MKCFRKESTRHHHDRSITEALQSTCEKVNNSNIILDLLSFHMLEQIRCSFMDEDALFILKVKERHPFI